MCKYSIHDQKTIDAKVGDNLTIGKTTASHDATYGTFHGETGCLTCVKDQTALTLSGIPVALQEKYGISAREVAVMVDKTDRQEDELFFKTTGTFVPLMQLANQGIAVYVGVKHSTDQAVADLIAEANKAAAQQNELADA